MKTYNFRLDSATATVVFDTLVRVIRYDEGSGTGTPKIRIKALSTGEFDVEMIPGRQIKLPEIVRGLVITNLTAAPITGKLTIGAGEISDNSLLGTVTLDAATLAALESIDLNAATLAALNYPKQSTGYFSNNAALAANTAVNIFSAAVNVNGAVLLSADMTALDSATPINSFVQTFIGKGTAPANALDGEVYLQSYMVGFATGDIVAGHLEVPQLVPAGVGLWFVSSASLPSGGRNVRTCRYRML